MAKETPKQFTRRERQIMEIIYQRGQATAAEVLKDLPDPPSYSAVRTLMRILEEKGHLTHEQQANRHVFKATVPHEKAKRSALKSVLNVFFENSVEAVVATLLDVSRSRLTSEEAERLSRLIEASKKDEK